MSRLAWPRFFAALLSGIILVSPAIANPPQAPAPHPAIPQGIDPALQDWTPRPATGKAEPWEKATEKDWIDGRFRLMDTGPFLGCTMSYSLGDNPGVLTFKALALKLGERGEAGVVFDRCTMRINAAWMGGFLQHTDRRFGLLNTPTPRGDRLFATVPGPGWAGPEGQQDIPSRPATSPLPANWAAYRGVYRCGEHSVLSYTVGKSEVLESPSLATLANIPCLIRAIRLSPCEHSQTILLERLATAPTMIRTPAGHICTWSLSIKGAGQPITEVAALKARPQDALLERNNHGELCVQLPPSQKSRLIQIIRGSSSQFDAERFAGAVEQLAAATDPESFTHGGRRLWGEPLVTTLQRGDGSGPFAIDTLTIPYQNPFGALFFCTGLDFLPDGRIAVCTCHGDVWLVSVNERTGQCSWQRFATGLYQPLGLRVVDGHVVVLERGQLTRLHDYNNDGEADFYECISNNWDTGAGEHSYDTCLETDLQGNYYFFKTGDTDLPTGGCLMRVSADGKKAEVFATGFRHPIGLGMSPRGILTGADQEGNWMPATRIDEYQHGGFYGDLRAHHRTVAPTIYDPPLCWLPREVDNSAGGQVWVPEGSWGPLSGLPIHFSYGRCKAFVLLRQRTQGGLVQGGAVDLGLKFLSGVCRGRFNPNNGLLYVCGLNGWQTAAQADGCLQRVRMTGQSLDIPVALAVDKNTIHLKFSSKLDRESAVAIENYRAAWWNYRWSKDYGSKRWKVSDPKVEGQDEFSPLEARLLEDGQTVELRFEKLQPVMQMQVGYHLTSSVGRTVSGSVFLTINTTEK